MAFLPFHSQRWRRGAILVSEPDMIPDDALRRAVNVRLDRTLGVIEARPGWVAKTASALSDSINFLARLVGASATFSYAQSGTDLQRLDTSWASGSSIATPGSQVVSIANAPDGNNNRLTYFVNGTIAIKDNGTTATTMGIAAPTAAPLSAALTTDLTTSIDEMDAHASWTGTDVGSKADDTAIWQEAPSSVSFTIAASTFGHIAQFLGGAINLDTLTDGDDLVKNDDYIHLRVRVDRPERITYIIIEIDVDSTATNVGNAFLRNYYSIRLGSLAALNQGANQWTRVQVRKASFQRFGTDTAVDWSNSRGFRIGFLTNAQGTATINVDDFKLRGGVGLEGDIEYTVSYRSSATDGRGNPPKDSDGVVLYTTAVTTDRQRINLTTSNVIQGGANHPGDAQITHMTIWRRGGAVFSQNAVEVDEIVDGTASPYRDNTSDETLVLTNRLLEADNDPPPTGTSTRVLFGPSASGHFFMIVDGFRLHFSKAYEDADNRVENWPALSFALIGDGSARAIAGVASATQVRVWTTERTYNVVGVGLDTFLPVALDGTRGAVGQRAVTAGDGVLFFVSQDGIYEDRVGQQRKLTSAIDLFFQGITVDGQPGWNTASAATGLVQLAFLPESTGSVLVMVYAEAGSGSSLNRFLVLKPNAETGRLTECFFGRSARTTIQSVYLDSLTRELLAGGADGHVYRIEDPAAYDDAGTAIAITSRTKSYDLGQSQRSKFVAHAVAEGLTTSQDLTLTAYYDRAASSEALGTVNTATETSLVQLSAADPEAPRRDVALEVSGAVTARVAISRLGFTFEAQPESFRFVDSGIISYDFLQQCKRGEFDINAPAACTVTIFADGVQVFQGQLIPTSGRQNLPYPFPPGLRGRTWRVTVLSDSAFLLYRFSAFMKQIGTDQRYSERVFIAGV